MSIINCNFVCTSVMFVELLMTNLMLGDVVVLIYVYVDMYQHTYKYLFTTYVFKAVKNSCNISEKIKV